MFTTLPVDVVASVLFATAITVLTLRSGASLAIAFSLALVIANVLFAALPQTFAVGPALADVAPLVASGIFVVLALVLTFIIHRMTSSLVDDSARPMLAILAGAATTVVLLTVWQLSPALQTLWTFNPMIETAFGEAFRLFWLLAAFTAFAFVKS